MFASPPVRPEARWERRDIRCRGVGADRRLSPPAPLLCGGVCAAERRAPDLPLAAASSESRIAGGDRRQRLLGLKEKKDQRKRSGRGPRYAAASAWLPRMGGTGYAGVVDGLEFEGAGGIC